MLKLVSALAVLSSALAMVGGSAPAAVKPAGRILFTRDVPGATVGINALYSVRPDGTGVRKLASTVRVAGPDADRDCEDDRDARPLCFAITEAKWSPDGTHVAFIRSTRAGHGGLYVANADGSGARRLFRNFPSNLDWAPDSRRIVFVAYVERRFGLFVARLGGGVRRIVAETARGYPSRPAWSLDGTLVAFVVRNNRPDEIWVVRPDGSGRRRVAVAYRIGEGRSNDPDETVSWGSLERPSWSADSRWLAYVAQRGFGPVLGDVELVRRDGRARRRFTQSADVDDAAFFAPRGVSIAYPATIFRGVNEDGEAWYRDELFVHRGGGQVRERIDDTVRPEGERFYGPTLLWSPDATRIAFYRYHVGQSGIYVRTLAKPGITRIVSGNVTALDW